MFDWNLNKLAKFLKANKLTIATAESCTGGLLSSRLTDISGSSDFVKLNFVTYAYEAKEEALGVSHELLVKYSAVSYECAKAMAEGLQNRTNCDIALCTTGIAGPTGGSKEKPVGTIYISALYKGKLLVKKYNLPPIATVIGRYYIMDRDNRWDRVEKGYNALLLGEGEHAATACDAVKQSYARGDNDEFVLPTVIGGEESRIHDNDAIIFFNYRPDRAREITKAINFEKFDGFERKAVRKNIYYVCMTQYDETFTYPVAFGKELMKNILGDVLEANGVKQFRTAETEKYAHVTFFFNGGVEEPQAHETRVLVPSPKVATYDMQPEMSAPQVCEKVLGAIDDPEYGFILVNFANPDMVGHTGVIEAATKACHVVDECVGKIADACKKHNITMILTADHGNSEVMVNAETGKPQTAHTTNEVPFVIINGDPDIELKEGGALCNVAPTVLQLMGIPKPAEMDCDSLIK